MIKVLKVDMGKNHPTGEKMWSAKLTEEKVRQIRERRKTGELLKSIAKDFGVAESCIHKIFTRKQWKCVP